MNTIGTVHIDFRMDNESFAQQLYARWDAFFRLVFEEVVDEVLSAYDREDEVLTIDTLSVDLGSLLETELDEQFPHRLREALRDYFHELMHREGNELLPGVHRETMAQGALELLCCFLLHGYLPLLNDERYKNVSLLLAEVLQAEAYRFREFLEAYGHYDFLYKRLVFQFSDEELEEIVRVVQPSESKFVNLYVRVQIRSYEEARKPDVSVTDYRDTVWILVLAYLFAESGSRFSRKQLVMHTLRGLSAHFNLSVALLVRILTDELYQLEQKVAQMPELWSILAEIRIDVRGELWALDGDYLHHAYRDIIAAVRFGKTVESYFFLSAENLARILGEPKSCRELLAQLQESEIHTLVGAILPQEKEFIVSYAYTLDQHKEKGTFSGRAGSDFRLLKWEFIFSVLFSLPLSAFSRKQFVLGVLLRLSAHYNLSVGELIRLLFYDAGVRDTLLFLQLMPVLAELERELKPREEDVLPVTEIPLEELIALLSFGMSARVFIRRHTEQEIEAVIRRVLPGEGEFIVTYARLLEHEQRYHFLEGKAGSEFRALKWEFILACSFYDKGVTLQRKLFVYAVLQRLAAHYNQQVIDLLGYFYQELASTSSSFSGAGSGIGSHFGEELCRLLREWYEEILLPLADTHAVKQMDKKAIREWLLSLFGEETMLSGGEATLSGGEAMLLSKEVFVEKWLIYALEEQTELFRSLWKAGKLNERMLLGIVNRTPTLQRLWLRRIGDARVLDIYRRWQANYATLRSRYPEVYFLQSIAGYLSVWMVQLTGRAFSGWSAEEIIRFLVQRIRVSIPPGMSFEIDIAGTLLKNESTVNEIINQLKERKKIMEKETAFGLKVNNGGVTLLAPFFPRLFTLLDYLAADRKTFKDLESKQRAIFCIQYLVYGREQEYAEHELSLNKLLVNYEMESPLPRKLMLTEEEIKIADSLVDSVRMSWSKLKNTSPEGIRRAFIERGGNLVLVEERSRLTTDNCQQWELRIEEHAYDIILDSVPWGFKLVRFSWMNSIIEVKWR